MKNYKRLDEGFEVGSMKFRDPPENKDSFYKRRTARDKEGNFTYISKASNGMNYNSPVKKNGEPRRYFQFLMEIVANPGITRKEILKKVYSRIDRPINIFMHEDLLLLKLIQKEVKQWDYIARVIYQYNHSLASYLSKSTKKIKESSREDYQYICDLIKNTNI